MNRARIAPQIAPDLRRRSRREQLRRGAQLPLENILLAIEEMQDIAQQRQHTRTERLN